MFESISNSWGLAKASWSVLRADKELIVFPLVSMIGAIVVTATFVVPAILTGMFASLQAGEQASRSIAAVGAFLFYVVLYTVIFYCNTALVGAALIRLRGGDPTLRDGFRIASQHIGPIFGYALIAATVGMILRWLGERGVLGRIASGLFGLAWNLATYFVVPILVTENVNPIEAVKRSAALLKKTWGEQIAGGFGIGMITFLMFFGTILIAIPLMILAGSVSGWLVLAVGVLLLLTLVGIGLISSALTGIYSAAVYQYATAGTTSAYFQEDQIRNAFRVK